MPLKRWTPAGATAGGEGLAMATCPNGQKNPDNQNFLNAVNTCVGTS